MITLILGGFIVFYFIGTVISLYNTYKFNKKFTKSIDKAKK